LTLNQKRGKGDRKKTVPARERQFYTHGRQKPTLWNEKIRAKINMRGEEGEAGKRGRKIKKKRLDALVFSLAKGGGGNVGGGGRMSEGGVWTRAEAEPLFRNKTSHFDTSGARNVWFSPTA